MPADPTVRELADSLEDDLDLPDYEVEDDEDGGAVVRIPSREPTRDDTDFYDNLVDRLDPMFVASLGHDLSERITQDIDGRRKRDEMYAEGLKRTGLGNEAPGGAQFQGASKVVHPMLTNASVEFQSRAIKELIPPGSVVKSFIAGTIDRSRLAKAERKAKYFNWQLLVQMEEFRPELEKTLAQTSLSGAHYLRFVWDPRSRRPVSSSASTDKVLLPYGASSFYTAERITYIDDITEMEYDERVRSGMYRDVDRVASSVVPDGTRPDDAKDKIAGTDRPMYNMDGLRRTYEVNTYLKGIEEALDNGPSDGEGEWAPYLVYLDESSREILAIVRNWEQASDRRDRMHWLVEFPFVPWDGAYPIGFIQMIGGLSGAATGALRALLDSAHANNFPGALKLKGSNVGGQSKSVNPGEIVELDGGVGADDIRKLAMPLQPGQPSATLFNLLGFLVEAGQGTVRTTFENFQNTENPQMPATTTLALIEQGLAVVSSIIGRMHHSMQMVLKVLHRINRMYITDRQIRDDTGSLLAYRSDFEGPLDIVPVSDPNIPSDAHRFAQTQAISQRATLLPQIYDVRAVELRTLKAMKVQDPESLLLPKPEAKEMNAANENVAASLGRPIAAFPLQDHLAHLQAHLDFLRNPMLGANPLIAPKLYPIMAQHLSEHIVMWYASRTFDEVSDALDGRPLSEVLVDDPDVRAEMDRLIAQASPLIMEDAVGTFQKAMPIIQQAAEFVNSRQMPPPMDPSVVAAQRNQIDAQKAQMDAQVRTQAIQQREAHQQRQDRLAREKMQFETVRDKNRQGALAMVQQARDAAAAQREQVKLQSQEGIANLQEQGDTQRKIMEVSSREKINTQDNMTALQIAEAEIESGEKVAVKTGRGINPG